jgi:hypothetical protein
MSASESDLVEPGLYLPDLTNLVVTVLQEFINTHHHQDKDEEGHYQGVINVWTIAGSPIYGGGTAQQRDLVLEFGIAGVSFVVSFHHNHQVIWPLIIFDVVGS